MTFWSGEKILKNQYVVDGFDSSQLDTNVYDLKMGDCYYVTGSDQTPNDQVKKFLKSGEQFVIPAGQFAFLISAETVNVPDNAMAFISMKTGFKFKGLINVSGFHVDPGYSGKLVFSAYNASPSPVHICEGEELFKIWFADLDQKSSEDRVFQGDGQSTISNNLIRGMSKEIYSLQSMAHKFSELEKSVEQRFSEQKPVIDNLTSLWQTMQTGLMITLIAAIFTITGPTVLQTGIWLKDRVFSTNAETVPEASTD